MIPYGRQDITDDDIESVISVLKSDFLTQGPAVRQFEVALENYTLAKHAIAVNSATSALHIAYKALGVGPGDIVWTSPITFVATSNAAIMLGAEVQFVDIDLATVNMSIGDLEQRLMHASESGRLPKVLTPVHMGGQTCDMKAIYKLSLEYGFRVLEDASHSIGASYCESKVGACEFSDITVFSFHPVKIITTGEGGAALTQSTELAQKMRLFSSHGVTRDYELFEKASEGTWFYQQIALGYNYRITDIQAALGSSQIKRIDDYVDRRHAVFDLYHDKLSNAPLNLPSLHPDGRASLHLYLTQIDTSKTKKSRKGLFDWLRAHDIGVNVHYIPVHTHPYYRDLGFEIGDFPKAEQYYQNAISLPLHPKLTTDEQGFVIDKIFEFFAQ